MRRQLKMTTLAMIASAGLAFVGCGEKKEDDDKTEETASNVPGGSGSGAVPGSITMSGTLALAGTALTASSIADYVLFCVTFESTPASSTSQFDDSGNFSVTIKANTPFGCFVNDKVTNATKASFVLETGLSGGLGGGSASSMALSGDVDLGALTISESGEVKIPAAKVEGKKTVAISSLDLDQVHNGSYKMDCLDTGDAARYKQCMDMLQDGTDPLTVFFRILKGTKGDESVFGLGVWQDKASFDNCGGFDVTTAQQTSITSEGYVLSQVSAGAFAGANCKKRDDEKPLDMDNIDNYYAFNRLIPTAAGYSFFDEEKGEHGQCKYYHSTAIEFAGTASEMIGAFSTKDFRSGDCGDEGPKEELAVFNVKFVKQ